MNTTILVCSHKKDYVKNDSIYKPIHVGKSSSNVDLGILGDDNGDSISGKNKNFCELTAHYWAWKNLKDVEYIGLAHYRRYFNFKRCLLDSYIIIEPVNSFIRRDITPNIKDLFPKYDIVLAKPHIYTRSLKQDYIRYHIHDDYVVLDAVVKELYPEYVESFDFIMTKTNKSYIQLINAILVNSATERVVA